MAAVLATSDLLKIVTYCQAAEQVAQNVRYYYVSAMGVGVSPTDEDVVTAFTNAIKVLYLPLMGASANFVGCTLQKISPVKRDTVAWSNLGVGTAAGDLLPRETAGLISFRTGYAGRQNRGRMYVPFPAESWNDANGHPTAGYVTAMEALRDFVVQTGALAPAGTATITLQSIIIPSDQPQGRAITAGTAHTRWASMRSRGDFAAANSLPF